MKDVKTSAYLIRALTNLHPGSGDVEYGVVDKLVQRDPISNFPTIHMSAIKGALKEHFKTFTSASRDLITGVFGSDPNDSTTARGKLHFISADLIALPRPSPKNEHYFELCYAKKVWEHWSEKAALLGWQGKAGIENLLSNIKTSSPLAEDKIEDFKDLAEELPVVARNHLDNGESKNLWYEEFVPRESIFAMIVRGPQEEMDDFDKHVNGKVIQLGGNATVGYGYCLFTRIKETPSPSANA